MEEDSRLRYGQHQTPRRRTCLLRDSLLAVLSGLVFACNIFLFFINPSIPGFVQALLLAACFLAVAVSVFYLLSRRLSSRLDAFSGRQWALMLFLSAAIGLLALSLFPSFPKLPSRWKIEIQTLEENNPRSQGQTVHLLEVQSDLASENQGQFQAGDGWSAGHEGDFSIENTPGATLNWRGRVLNSITLFFEASPSGGMVQITWGDGAVETVGLYADSLRTIAIGRDVYAGTGSRCLVYITCWLAFFLAVLFSSASLYPEPLVRIPWLEKQAVLRLFLFFALAAAMPAFLESSGLLRDYPLRDSSVFLYSGQNILSGGIPYRDVWDHKGPLIYYLNALGLWVGNGSRIGVLLLEVGFILVVFYGLCRQVERQWGLLPAAGVGIALLAGLNQLYDGGNLSEEYALLFQVFSFSVFLSFRRKPGGSKTVLLGVLAAAGFLLRPNLLSTQATAAGLMLLRPSWQTNKNNKIRRRQVFFGLAAGFLAPVLAVTGYFAIRGAGWDMFDQMIGFNLLYSSSSETGLIERLWIPFRVMKQLWISLPTLGSLILAAFDLWKQRKNYVPDLLALASIDLVAGLFIYNLSGKGYKHYFLNLLPAAAILCGYLVWKLTQMTPHKWKVKELSLLGHYGVLLLLAGWMALNSVFYLPDILTKIRAVRAAPNPCEYLEQSLNPQDTVLMWGIETPFYISTGLRSPTRYIYQTALLEPRYAGRERGEEVKAALEYHATSVIIDTSPTNSEFPPLEPEPGASTSGETPAVTAIREEVGAHYRLEGPLPCFGGRWLLYRRIPAGR